MIEFGVTPIPSFVLSKNARDVNTIDVRMSYLTCVHAYIQTPFLCISHWVHNSFMLPCHLSLSSPLCVDLSLSIPNEVCFIQTVIRTPFLSISHWVHYSHMLRYHLFSHLLCVLIQTPFLCILHRVRYWHMLLHHLSLISFVC